MERSLGTRLLEAYVRLEKSKQLSGKVEVSFDFLDLR